MSFEEKSVSFSFVFDSFKINARDFIPHLPSPFLWPYSRWRNRTCSQIYIVLTACVFLCAPRVHDCVWCTCVCVCVFQSLSPKPVYLWLPSEVAGRLPAGQPHWDKRRPLHQPSTARQQTDRTNQEQEVPLLRYKHAVLWNSVDRLRHIIHKLTHCPVFSFCVFLLGFSLSLSLLTSSPFFAASLSCDHTHTHGVLSFRLFFKLFFTFTLSLSLH